MRTAFVSLFFLSLGAACFADPIFFIGGNAAAEFNAVPTAEQAIDSFSSNPKPMWGAGWELVARKLGFGGVAMVKFFQDPQEGWAIDWYGQAVLLSFHLFGGGAFLDPFAQAGAGCAGRALPSSSGLYTSIFPFIAAGLALDISGFTFGAKLSAVPFQTQVPGTQIPLYTVGSFQVQLFAGITLGR
jgi:hypothetical protein